MVTTSDQCAVAEGDYTSISAAEYTFATTSETLEIPLTIKDDTLVEEKEQFQVAFTIKDKTVNDLYGEVDKTIVVIFSEDTEAIGRHFQMLRSCTD